MKEFLDPDEASRWLLDGKILLHPTEGIWGIGCHATNQKAVEKIINLKQRDASKNFILLSPSSSKALEYFNQISEEQIEFLDAIWPGHTTVLFEPNLKIPNFLKSFNKRSAIRVSNHLHINNLLNSLNDLMVSTSANISGHDTPTDLKNVIDIFPDPEVAVYAYGNGEASKPSSIIDLKSMEYIRE